jgi:hypothetical protein
VIEGLTVAVFLERGEEREQAFDKVEEALKLISRHDPVRFSRLRKDVKRILVAGSDSYRRGYWVRRSATCVLTSRYVGTPEIRSREVAGTIVHEATHARLERAGIRTTATSRDRVERLCVKAQLAFARRIPDAGDLVTHYEETLAERRFSLPTSQRREMALRDLRELDLPRWVMRLLEKWLGRAA